MIKTKSSKMRKMTNQQKNIETHVLNLQAFSSFVSKSIQKKATMNREFDETVSSFGDDKRKSRMGLLLLATLVVLGVVGVVSSTNRGQATAVQAKNMVAKKSIETELSVSADSIAVPSGISCSTVNNQDIPHNDLKKYTHVTSIGACHNECKKNPECRCYAYKASSDECWLKDGPCNNVESKQGTSYGLCRGRDRASITCTRNQNTDVSGNDIERLSNVYSLSDCQNKCKANLNCNCYAYRGSDDKCWLKKGSCDNHSSKPGTDSGVCTNGCA